MALPLIPLAIVGAGAAMGAGYSAFKKPGPQTSTVTHAPYETYAPQKSLQYSPVSSIQYPSYQIQIDSPASYQSMKKTADIDSKPVLKPTQDVSPVGSGDMSTGLDLVPIAIIGAVAFIGYGIIKKKL